MLHPVYNHGALSLGTSKGISLVAASAPTHFIEDTPTAVLVRQVLGAVAEFEKTSLVAKLAAARRRKRIATGEKVEGARAISRRARTSSSWRRRSRARSPRGEG